MAHHLAFERQDVEKALTLVLFFFSLSNVGITLVTTIAFT